MTSSSFNGQIFKSILVGDTNRRIWHVSTGTGHWRNCGERQKSPTQQTWVLFAADGRFEPLMTDVALITNDRLTRSRRENRQNT